MRGEVVLGFMFVILQGSVEDGRKIGGSGSERGREFKRVCGGDRHDGLWRRDELSELVMVDGRRQVAALIP